MADSVVVADMEPGLEHLSWGTLRHVDLLLVVVQPTAKVLLTARRTHRLATQLGIPEIAFVGNRASAASADGDVLEAFAGEQGELLLGLIPEDDAIRQADRSGGCVLDTAPGSPSVRAISRLADAVEARLRR